MQLQDKRAVVTGASEGIGRAISEAMMGKGTQVAGLARNSVALKELEDREDQKFLSLPCDIRDADAVAHAVKEIQRIFGRIDILVNNAGVGRFGPIDQLPKAQWDEMMETNVTGIYHMIHAVVPLMKKRKSGHIVNIASIAGLVGNPNLSGYNASKFAVRGLSDALFKELREFGIKVSAVFPGSVETGFLSRDSAPGASKKMSPREVAEVVVHVLERSENFLISEVVMRPLRTG